MSIDAEAVDNHSGCGHQYRMPSNGIAPTDIQVEAAARAWMMWQFPGRVWEEAVPEMKNKFRDGARRALIAAFAAVVDRKD